MVKKEPQPNLKLEARKMPYQKITINRMPLDLYKKLEQRSGKLNKTVPVYCRVILEHAIEHRQDYEGPLHTIYSIGPAHSQALTIPIVNKAFLKKLVDWDPYGVNRRTEIALSILKKHLEVRSTW